MKVNINGLMYALSFALDSVESELVGVSTGNGKRVAYISGFLGKALKMNEEQLSDLVVCAVMHDNALTQYIQEEYQKSNTDLKNTLGMHCLYGEENIRKFPFQTDMSDVILYHHETADGTGPFRRKGENTPLGAQLIHFADTLDKECDLGNNSSNKYRQIIDFLNKEKESIFLESQVDLFIGSFSQEELEKLSEDRIEKELRELVPDVMMEYSYKQMTELMDLFAKIIDYKSEFTRKHSLGIAKKAMKMGQYYGYDTDTCYRLYIAGALHDIGKMAISNDVLEKPDKLSDDEYVYMKNHAWFTYKILSQIEGFEDITHWASYHHERLNGKGYPFGKTAKDLDQNDRLLACLDVYQALGEPRPYKSGMPHEKCIDIMRNMADGGFLDSTIVEDINTYLKGES